MLNEYGTLTSKGRYTKFSFLGYTITFMNGKDLVRYVDVLDFSDGVLTVSCEGKVKKEYEDYIDIAYILTNLRMDPKVYLKGLKGVEVRYAREEPAGIYDDADVIIKRDMYSNIE